LLKLNQFKTSFPQIFAKLWILLDLAEQFLIKNLDRSGNKIYYQKSQVQFFCFSNFGDTK